MYYKIGDFIINVDEKYEVNNFQCEYYMCDAQPEDLFISVSNNDIEYERKIADNVFNDGYLEHVSVHRKIAEWLPLHNAFLLHSACFEVNGAGIAFSARSGTGKTTHLLKWHDLLGEKLTAVNGDKPIVRFFDDDPETPYAYGTPWNGKEHFGSNTRTVLKHICFIERSETNYVEKLDKSDAVERILNQVYMPKDPIAVMNTMSLIDRLLSCCNLWIIHCNMDDDAAETAYNAIFNA